MKMESMGMEGRVPFARRLRLGRKRGVTLWGVLLGFSLVVVATIAAVGLYNSAKSNMASNDSVELLNTIRMNVDRVYAGQSSYGTGNGSLVAVLDKRGGIPDSARKAGPPVTIEHPYGKAVLVVGDGGRFAIIFEDLDDEVCANLAQAYAGRTRARSGVVNIEVKAPDTVATGAPVVKDLAAITTACALGVEGNDLVFTFG